MKNKLNPLGLKIGLGAENNALHERDAVMQFEAILFWPFHHQALIYICVYYILWRSQRKFLYYIVWIVLLKGETENILSNS